MSDPEVTPEPSTVVRHSYRFAVVPEWIVFHPTLGPPEIRVYAALARFTDHSHTCYPSAETIGQCIGRSERAVRESLKALEAAGAIQVRHRRTTSVYTLAGDQPLRDSADQARKKTAAHARKKTSDKREPVERDTPLPPVEQPAEVEIRGDPNLPPTDEKIENLRWRLEKRYGTPSTPGQVKVREKQIAQMLQRGWEPVEVAKRADILKDKWPNCDNPIMMLIGRWDDWAPLTPGQMYGV